MDYQKLAKRPIIVLGSDVALRETICAHFAAIRGSAKNVHSIKDTKTAVNAATKEEYDYALVMLDTRQESVDCIELYQRVVNRNLGPVVVLVDEDDDKMETLRDMGAPYFLQKSLATELALRDAIYGAAQHWGLSTALKQSEHRFRAMADTMSDAMIFITPPDGVWRKSNFLEITDYNTAAANMFFGKKPLEKLSERKVASHLKDYDWPTINNLVQTAVKTNTEQEAELFLPALKKGGKTRDVWLELNVVPADTDACLMFYDITARKVAEEKLHYSEKRFRDIADSFSDWLWEIDTNMKLVYASRGRSVTGRGVKVGEDFTRCFLPEDQKQLRKDLKAHMAQQQPFYDREYWGMAEDGLRVCWRVSGVPMFDADGTFMGFRGISKDISEEKAAQDQLFYLANNDTLTGLYNRGRFYDDLKQCIRTMKRYNRQGALLLLDLDRFKYVNDTFGHEAGDHLLIHIAHMLRDNIRSSDMIARLGGDEFAIILQEVDPKEVVNRANQILEEVKKTPFAYEGHEISVGASMGVVMFPAQGTAAGELLSKADIAMYRAKQEGRNRMHVFDESAVRDHGMAKRIEVVDFILRCLDEDRVELHFQPIIPLQGQDKEVKHYEVLCRMIDDEGNIVPPIHFIETAEDFGLISRIDEYVCTKALSKLSRWRKAGRDVALSINLSGITFDDEETLSRIGNILEAYNMPEGKVIFEITETAALKDIGRAQRSIRELKRFGCQFALDDFGVGYSSFNYIKHLDIDFLKIDGSFVRNLVENEDDRVFVKALADVAKGMNILTIAEMVEDEDIVDYLKNLGIDYGQGYHFGKPIPKLLTGEE